MEFDVDFSLHSNCHYQITYAKFNVKNHYLPPYECKAWRYQKATTNHVRKTVEPFVCDRSFKNLDIRDILDFSIELSKIFFQTIFFMKL